MQQKPKNKIDKKIELQIAPVEFVTRKQNISYLIL